MLDCDSQRMFTVYYMYNTIIKYLLRYVKRVAKQRINRRETYASASEIIEFQASKNLYAG